MKTETQDATTWIQTESEWPFDDIKADYYDGRNVWREVDAKFANYCLDILPPMDWKYGRFLISEPFSHDDNGHATHACIAEISGRYFARYVPRKDAADMVRELAKIVFG